MNPNGHHEIVSFVSEEEMLAAGETTIRCKFVVIKTTESLILAFGPIFRYAYHANILEALCASRAILTRWERLPDCLEILDSHTTVRGGGYLAWNPSSLQAHFGGSSKAYGLFDPDQLRAILDANPHFIHHDVTIEE
jgi:hypothetical protein